MRTEAQKISHLSGMQVPALRAFIMISVMFLGVLLSRRAVSLYTLLWANKTDDFIRKLNNS